VSFEDELDAMRRRDDALERHEHAFQRADRLADYAPAPDDDLAEKQADAFLDATDRALAIWHAADNKPALAEGVGTTTSNLLTVARAHFVDSNEAYPSAALPDLIVFAIADAFLLGVLAGRELPKP
jgi:hypothetical protein